MNTLTFARCDRRTPVGAALRVARHAILFCMLAVTSCAFADGGPYASSNRENTDMAPWTPDIVEAIDAYVPSPTFNNGLYFLDHFAAPSTADVAGGITAQMSNGDIVVAGLVPDFGSSTACNNGIAKCNIGLVRYSSSGVRLAWTNPGSYGHLQNEYVIYPGSGYADIQKYQYIRDIKERNGTIYVMVDQQTDSPGLGRQNVRVITFNSDGSPLAPDYSAALGIGLSAQDNEDFYGAQMVFVSNNRMMVTATTYNGVNSYLSVNKMNVNSDGSLSQSQTWGSGYAGDTTNRIIRYSSNLSYTVGYATNQGGFATQDDFYVAGSISRQGDYDLIVQKISSLNGSYKSEFDGGFVFLDFHQTNSSYDDYAGGLYVYQDEVYVGAQVAQKCHAGVGVARINGATGDLIGAFGSGGKIVFGGQGNSVGCFSGNNATVPTAISATGGRIGIVGYQASNSSFGGGPTHFDAMLAVVNAVDGSVLDFHKHPLTRADGSRYGDSTLYGVYGGPNGTSPFTVAGVGRDENFGNTLSYVTGRFIPVSADRIFASGFGTDNDY